MALDSASPVTASSHIERIGKAWKRSQAEANKPLSNGLDQFGVT